MLNVFVFRDVIREHVMQIVLAIPPARAQSCNDTAVCDADAVENRVARVILRMSNPASDVLIQADEEDAKPWVRCECAEQEERQGDDYDEDFERPVRLEEMLYFLLD